jgi:hypothetical protein
MEHIQASKPARISLELQDETSYWNAAMLIRVPVITEIAPAVLEHYRIDFIEPRLVNKLMLTVERRTAFVDERTTSLGLIFLLNEDNTGGVALTWGFQTAPADGDGQMSAWCSMLSLAEIRNKLKDSAAERDPVSWVHNAYAKAKRFNRDSNWTVFCSNRSTEALASQGLRVPLVARIRSRHFLGNTVLTLTVDLA